MKLADFVLTGTGVYGPKRPGESGIDIVLMHEDAEDLKQALMNFGVGFEPVPNLSPYANGSFYFTIGRLKFNIIQAANDRDFEHWRFSTERMKDFSPIEDRKERLAVFRGYDLEVARKLIKERRL